MECNKLGMQSCVHFNEMEKNRRLEAAIDGNWELMVTEALEEQEQYCTSCDSFEPIPDYS